MESHNLEIYRECCVPKPPEQAQADWEAFCKEVYGLRVKHQIPDLCLVARMVLQYPEGEGQAMTIAHFGDELQAEPMTAWAFGHEQSESIRGWQRHSRGPMTAWAFSHEQSERQQRIARVVLDATKAMRTSKAKP